MAFGMSRFTPPMLLPEAQPAAAPAAPKALPPTKQGGRPPAPAVTAARKMAIVRSASKHLKGLPPGKAAVLTAGGIRYVQRGDYEPEPVQEKPAKPKRPAQPRAKNDPKHVAAAAPCGTAGWSGSTPPRPSRAGSTT